MSMNRVKPIQIHENPQERFAAALKAVVTLPKEKVQEYQREHKPFTKPKTGKPNK